MIFKIDAAINHKKENIIYLDTENKRYHTHSVDFYEKYVNLIINITNHELSIYPPTVEYGIRMVVDENNTNMVLDKLNQNIKYIQNLFENIPTYSLYHIKHYPKLSEDTIKKYKINIASPFDNDKSSILIFPNTIDNKVLTMKVLKYGLTKVNGRERIFLMSIPSNYLLESIF